MYTQSGVHTGRHTHTHTHVRTEKQRQKANALRARNTAEGISKPWRSWSLSLEPRESQQPGHIRSFPRPPHLVLGTCCLFDTGRGGGKGSHRLEGNEGRDTPIHNNEVKSGRGRCCGTVPHFVNDVDLLQLLIKKCFTEGNGIPSIRRQKK